MTCKDCIHNDVCYTQEVCNDIDEQIEEFGCEDFKEKSQFVNCEELKLYIQNYIREIQMNDYGNDEGIHELWQVYEYIEKLSKGCTKKPREKN